MSAEQKNIAAWDNILASLEADLAWADQDHARDLGVWNAPEGLGLLPAVFAARATAIVEAQRRLLATLAAERSDVARHLAALRTVPRPNAGQNAYLDLTA